MFTLRYFSPSFTNYWKLGDTLLLDEKISLTSGKIILDYQFKMSNSSHNIREILSCLTNAK